MSRTSQNGSIISFVVVGVLLSAMVLGGLYVVSERNFFGLGDEMSEVAVESEDAGEAVTDEAEEATEEIIEESSESSDTGDVVVDTDEPALADEDSADAESSQVAEESESAESTASDEASESDETTADEMVVAGVSAETAAQASQSAATNADTQELPVTGPSETLFATLGVSALVAAALAYRRSSHL